MAAPSVGSRVNRRPGPVPRPAHRRFPSVRPRLYATPIPRQREPASQEAPPRGPSGRIDLRGATDDRPTPDGPRDRVWLVDNTTLNFSRSATSAPPRARGAGHRRRRGGAGREGLRPHRQQPAHRRGDQGEADPLRRSSSSSTPPRRRGEAPRPPLHAALQAPGPPAAILWLVKFHPELSDGQIAKLVGTTKPTILTIRERTHWNIGSIDRATRGAGASARRRARPSAVAVGARALGMEAPSAARDECESSSRPVAPVAVARTRGGRLDSRSSRPSRLPRQDPPRDGRSAHPRRPRSPARPLRDA
jgi:hypothetical protein